MTIRRRPVLAAAWLRLLTLQALAPVIAPLAMGLSIARPAQALPTESFARLPQVSFASLSPDGTWFAALMNRGSATVAVARPVGGEQPPKALFEADNREFTLAWVRWVSDQRLLISVHYPDRRGFTDVVQTRLVAVDRDGGKLLRLTTPQPFIANGDGSQFQDQVIDWLPGDGHHVLMQASSSRADISPSVFKVDIDSGEREVVHGRRFGVLRWMTDSAHRVRVGLRQQGTRFELLVTDRDGEHWRTAWQWELGDRAAVEPLGFGDDPDRLYIRADDGGHRAVFEVDLRDPALARKRMLAFPGRDATGTLLNEAVSGRALGLAAGREGLAGDSFWAPDAQALAGAIDAALPGRANRLQQLSADGSRYLVFSSGNGMPGQFMVGDRARGEMSVLARQYPEIPARSTALKQRQRLAGGDGKAITAFLSLPPGASAAAPLPALVLIGGGPLGRDTADFDPLPAFLADRGYAVLQLPGSRPGDIAAAIDWMVKQGTADRARVCVVGSGYGGQAALLAATEVPAAIRCVVSLGGVTDLPAMASWRSHYVNGLAVFESEQGDDRQRQKEASPSRLAARFQAPVLLFHGTDDRRVPYAQSQTMDEALGTAGKPHRLLTLQGGDHGLSFPDHRLLFYRELENFLGEQLQPGRPAARP